MRAAELRATDRTLRDLDPATRALDRDQRRRATETLARVLTTDPDLPVPPSPTVAPPAPPAPPRRRPHRALVAGGMVAAAITVAVLVPVVVGGDEAFASWSPSPSELTGADRRATVDACLVLQADDEGELAFDPAADASVLLAESRGGWSYVVFTVVGASGRTLEGSCLVPDSLVSDPRPGEGGFFGSLGGAEETAGPAPGREAVREDTSGFGSVDDEAFVYAEGRAGADVVGIDVTTPGGREVEASIENGRWAVWWPAGDDSMDNPELTGAPSYAVTLRDGTVADQVHTPW
jgi:hypothetical protein